MSVIYFRVDGSQDIGVGHIMRCLTLAIELSSRNYICEFICKDHESSSVHYIKKSGFMVHIIEMEINYASTDIYKSWLGGSGLDDAYKFVKIISNNSQCIVIVDHYGIDYIWENIVSKFCSYILAIDDLANRMHHCDCILDSAIRRKKSDYSDVCLENSKLLLGSDYILLRREFNMLRGGANLIRKKTKKIETILLNFGGTDPLFLSKESIEILMEIKFKGDINIILSSDCKFVKELMKIIDGLNNIYLHVDCTNVAEIMMNSDLAVGNFGSSSWERCCLGLPAIVIVSADNQDYIASSLTESGAVIRINESEIKKTLMGVLERPLDMEWWHNMSEKALKICDGLGAQRVANSLIENVS